MRKVKEEEKKKVKAWRTCPCLSKECEWNTSKETAK